MFFSKVMNLDCLIDFDLSTDSYSTEISSEPGVGANSVGGDEPDAYAQPQQLLTHWPYC